MTEKSTSIDRAIINSLSEYDNKEINDAIKKFMPLVIKTALKYASRNSTDYDDLIMSGVEGIVEAIAKFDKDKTIMADKEIALSMFIGDGIEHSTYKYHLNSCLITTPEYIVRAAICIKKMIKMLETVGANQELIERTITDFNSPSIGNSKIEEKVETQTRLLKKSIVRLARQSAKKDGSAPEIYNKFLRTRSLILYVNEITKSNCNREDIDSISHRIADDNVITAEDGLFMKERQLEIENRFGSRNTDILLMRAKGYKYKEIGDKYKCSRQTVSKLVNRMLLSISEIYPDVKTYYNRFTTSKEEAIDE